MFKKFFIIISVFVFLATFPVAVFAHSGRTDAKGCHTNRKTGDYHCHNVPTNIENKEAKKDAKIFANTEAKKESSNKNKSAISVSEQKLIIIRIIDGDTIELSNGKKVRYIGIDTPETVDPRKPVQCFGQEAKEANLNLVLNKEVVLKNDVSETDKYGRLLRYVYLSDGTFVNLWLVKNGFAHAYTYPPDITYSNEFILAEKEARESGSGLWSACQ